MKIPNNLYEDKERGQADLLMQLENTKYRNALNDDELDLEKDFIKLQRQRRRLGAMLLVATCLCAALLLSILAIHEACKMRGMTFAVRTESLPVSASGMQQLRAIDTLFSNKERGLQSFTPFNSASQTPGELRVVTNYTNPSYLAYVVRHPEIQDVVLITDAFFCSKTTCFYIVDVHNDAFFTAPVTEYRDLTHMLVKVPLPAGSTFVKAEHCGHLYFNTCNILLRTATGHQKLADLVQDSVNDTPEIQYKQEGDRDDFAWMAGLNAEIKAFSTGDQRLAVWIEGQLAITTHEQSADVDLYKGPLHHSVEASIDDVDRHDVVEMLAIAKHRLMIVLVMRRIEAMQTRVRIHAVAADHTLIRYDELTLPNRPEAITVLARDKSFEICELVGQQLKCYSNVIYKPVE